jgi:Amidases related to nicotinamidase
MANKMHPLGAPRAGYAWSASSREVDMATPAAKPVPLRIAAAPQNITIDLKRSAMVVIDMQNDFCSRGRLGRLSASTTRPTASPSSLAEAAAGPAQGGVPVIWVNWGCRPDLANMPPNQMHLYKPTGTGVGLGDPVPGKGEPVLQKDTGPAAVVDELVQEPEDIKVDKYRISGFWDTPLDSILRNLGTRTVLFSGVNTDQCVMHSLTDANFLGYGCVMVEDCCATTSPDFCTEASVWNVKKCFGFVTDSGKILKALKK